MRCFDVGSLLGDNLWRRLGNKLGICQLLVGVGDRRSGLRDSPPDPLPFDINIDDAF